MKKLAFWLVLTLPALAQSQPGTELFRSVYDTLAKKSAHGYFGRKTGQPNAFSEDFTRLSWNFSDADLGYIARTANPLMKASAAQELVRRKSGEIAALFAETLHDPQRITVFTGENADELPLAVSLFNDVALQKEIMERKAYYEKTSTAEQMRGLKALFGNDFESRWSIAESDSLMNTLAAMALCEENVAVETLSRIFRLNQFRCGDYGRIRQFAQKSPTPEILATLASFHNKNDLPLLKKHMPDALVAVSLFPHPSLLPILKSRLETDYEDVRYQQAIAAYKNPESKTLLKSICKKITESPANETRDQQLFVLRDLLEKENCALYSDLITQLEKDI